MTRPLLLAATIMLATAAAAAPEAERGTGAYAALYEERADLPDHVVYRPADLNRLGGRKLGLYVFGNGGCGADGTASRNHLLEIASHGYLVIASGTIPKAGDTAGPPQRPANGQLTAQTPTHLLTDAIDWAERENRRADSPLRGKLDPRAVAVSGWSCGGLQALAVAPDPRVKTVVVMNSGMFNDGRSPIPGIPSDKAALARLHGSVLYVLGGPTDIAHANGSDDYRRIEHLPAALVDIPVGHGGTYMQPHGGVAAEVVTAWLDWQLKGRRDAAARFVGPACGFCRDPRLSLQTKRLR
ncbi:hypothetical protein GCM10011380_16220 [Sphingomonas metalli]|uniref:Dienelactone hydrolase domain-containing protein n=1 Tax=Sphingomonas metalli TaxID=1779358 RepID=A0A916WS23_9SPHN|nr:hypothetical protein [Sphingomonas metalli]GGB27340.1 hypothetical protein GCM10011380_16220 [Sphingomonas metalli]